MSSIPHHGIILKSKIHPCFFGESCFHCQRVDNQKRNTEAKFKCSEFQAPLSYLKGQKRRSLGTPLPNTVFLYKRITLCRTPYSGLLLWLSSWLSNPFLPGRLLEMPAPSMRFSCSAPSPPACARLAPCDTPLEFVLQVLKPLHRLIMTLHLSPTAWPPFLFLCSAYLAQCLVQCSTRKHALIFSIVILIGRT